jgi:RNA polymerase sigma-70 factor (ECF subfamily)
MTESTTSPVQPGVFPRTHWSVVLAATATPSPESAAALEAICRAYWYPLYAYARRRGQSPQDAQDLTQDFFLLLLKKRWLEEADREKGRLRTFLITALKHFMAKEWRRASARRRGGAHVHMPIDTAFAESRYAADPDAALEAEAVFDRQWALTLLDLAMKRLQAEFTAAGKAAEFGVLKESLAVSHGALVYRSIAVRLDVSEGAARVAVHRLRKRFREVYREEISQTLPVGADVDAEMRHLASALAR